MLWTNRHRIRVCGVIAILTIAIAVPRVALPDSTAGRIFVLDGSAVHDVGEIHLNITNWGLIGSRPGTGQAYSDAPSAEWPAGSGVRACMR